MLTIPLIIVFICGVNYVDAAWTDGIYGGTKWCGNGNNAKSDDDLGKLDKLDACCRDHDKCPINLNPGKSGWGLTNIWFHTRSSCDCDNTFYKCMKNISGGQKTHADAVGNMYFQVVHPNCMKEYHPKKCTKKIIGICVKWKTDKSKTEWKWASGKYWWDLLDVISLL